jgi:hypothetical protein
VAGVVLEVLVVAELELLGKQTPEVLVETEQPHLLQVLL